jgi:hypothetical protein
MESRPLFKQQPPKKEGRAFKHSAVEGLLRGFGVAHGSAEMTEILELLDARNGLPAEYPVERYIMLIEWLARRHFPRLAQPEAFRSVGMRMLYGYW